MIKIARNFNIFFIFAIELIIIYGKNILIYSRETKSNFYIFMYSNRYRLYKIRGE
jgi:hypothetical protein